MNRLRNLWISDCKIGRVKQIYYKLLRKVFKFPEWHESPINMRPYAIETVRYVDSIYYETNTRLNVVEIGCGIGDIIGNIGSKYLKYGYDIDKSVLRAGRLVHPMTRFHYGSFGDVKIGNIYILIALGFFHRQSDKYIKSFFIDLFKNNDVKYVILESFTNTDNSCYEYSPDGEVVFEGIFDCVYKSSPLKAAGGAFRYIECWKRVGDTKYLADYNIRVIENIKKSEITIIFMVYESEAYAKLIMDKLGSYGNNAVFAVSGNVEKREIGGVQVYNIHDFENQKENAVVLLSAYVAPDLREMKRIVKQLGFKKWYYPMI